MRNEALRNDVPRSEQYAPPPRRLPPPPLPPLPVPLPYEESVAERQQRRLLEERTVHMRLREREPVPALAPRSQRRPVARSVPLPYPEDELEFRFERRTGLV